MNDKTHYRKAFNSPYLSSADIVGPTILTIASVRLEIDQTKKTKDFFNTAHFTEKDLRPGEPLKPMILNAHNSKIMANLTSSKFIDDWNNIAVTIYVDANVRFGRDTVEGLRISPEPPQTQNPVLTPEHTDKWASAVAAFERDGNLNKVLSRVSMSIEHQALVAQQARPKNAQVS